MQTQHIRKHLQFTCLQELFPNYLKLELSVILGTTPVFLLPLWCPTNLRENNLLFCRNVVDIEGYWSVGTHMHHRIHNKNIQNFHNTTLQFGLEMLFYDVG